MDSRKAAWESFWQSLGQLSDRRRSYLFKLFQKFPELLPLAIQLTEKKKKAFSSGCSLEKILGEEERLAGNLIKGLSHGETQPGE